MLVYPEIINGREPAPAIAHVLYNCILENSLGRSQIMIVDAFAPLD